MTAKVDSLSDDGLNGLDINLSKKDTEIISKRVARKS